MKVSLPTLALLALAIASLSACERPAACPCPDSVVTVVPLDPSGDGGTIEPDDEPFDIAGGYSTPVCLEACLNLKRLGCPEARNRPGEDSCYVVCRRAESTNKHVSFRPDCIAAAKDKRALLACNTYRCLLGETNASPRTN